MSRWLSLLLAAAVLAGCSKREESVRRTSQAVKQTVRGIYRVENSVIAGTARPRIVALDVAGLDAPALRRRLGEFEHPERTHLWMPGEQSWIVVEQAGTNCVSLSAAMEAVANDAACVVSLPEVFASYAGTLEEILPAFGAKLEGEVLPEWFVTRQVPGIGWLRTEDVDPDILRTTLEAVRETQAVRRLVLEGNMAARAATTAAGESAATDLWARAYLRNPRDPLLQDRLENLARNARGFLEVGKLLQAMKCYETMILVNPKDADAVRAFGQCLRKLGKEKMADEVLSRAAALAQPGKAGAE